jgi:hypothetical protein
LPFKIREWSVARGEAGSSVFDTIEDAFEYFLLLTTRDLQYNGKREPTVETYRFKLKANFLLLLKVKECINEHELEMLRLSSCQFIRAVYAYIHCFVRVLALVASDSMSVYYHLS